MERNRSHQWTRLFGALLLTGLLLGGGCGPASDNTEPEPVATPDASLAVMASTPTAQQPPAPTPAPPADPAAAVEQQEAPAPANAQADVTQPAEAPPADPPVPEEASADGAFQHSETGVVSFISDSLHGNPTASGGIYDKDAFVAAHKSLPFDTQVRVTNLFNGKTVDVVIVDRLPVNNPHMIDVSSAAADVLDLAESGNADARIEWND